jgi:hypothetical protein
LIDGAGTLNDLAGEMPPPMFGLALRMTALSLMVLADSGQADPPREPKLRSMSPVRSTTEWPIAAEVTVEKLVVHDQPNEASYINNALSRGDRVQIRGIVEGGWLAIDPPSTTLCWIEQSAIDRGIVLSGPRGRVSGPTLSRTSSPERAWVTAPRAVVRSGHPSARLPGPPRGYLHQGTMVRLIDRPPLKIGRGQSATVWYAIMPASSEIRYIRANGTRAIASPRPQAAEIQAAYAPARDAPSAPGQPLPAPLKTEIENLESMQRAIVSDQPIEQWRFEAVRAGYQALLKRAGADPVVEETIRIRLARLTQYEQAARAARTIQEVLAQSHRRDREVAQVERKLAAAARPRARPYNVVGFVQPSARKVDGRKLYALIGADGSTLAYLDVPPGIDVDPLFSRRIGVRGEAHYDEDLGTRLITVRDLESIESKR